MKITTSILIALGIGVALMSSTTSPVVSEKKEAVVASTQPAKAQSIAQSPSFSGAIQVIVPQKDLESAIRNSEQGDVLLLGQDGWYCVRGRAMQQGTRMYVLGGPNAMLSAFPKEADSSAVR